ncbi:hypothetical protein ACFL57_05360, partial [Candidatus Margulisiibacteriota bacterium]
PMAINLQKEAVSALQKNPPRLIILAAANYSWMRNPQSPTLLIQYLNNILENNYILVGGFIPTPQGGFWQEPLTGGLHRRSSLMLFTQK